MNVYDVIRGHEGFSTTAYWDGNHWRVGYGSDTYVDDEGNVRRVTKDTVVTREQAERDLIRRVPEFQEEGIKKYLNAGVWESLPESVKIAVTSVAYNYGSIAELNSLKNALNTGDINLIADTIESYGSHNNGVNKRRRKEEAELIRGGPIPPSDIPTVGTQLDTAASKTGGINLERVLSDKNLTIAAKTNLVLDSLYTPYPEPRVKGTAARTKEALREPESVPMPRNRPERDPTLMTPAAQSGKYEYTAAGKPRDPDTGFLMSESDPRYAEAMGIKSAPQPRPASERPAAKEVARLPELDPPMDLSMRQELARNQSHVERPTKPKPGQSQIERSGLMLTTPVKSAGLNLKEVLASDSMNEATPTSDGKSAKANRVEQAAEQTTLPRSTPQKKETPASVRIAGGLAGQVALPAGVRPEIPSTEVTRLPEVLPGGSNEKAIGFTYAGQEGKKAPAKAAPASAQANIESAKAEQQATRQNLERITPTKIDSKLRKSDPAKGKLSDYQPVLLDPENPAARPGSTTATATPDTSAAPSKHKSAPEPKSLNESVTGMISDWFGIKDKGAAERDAMFMGTITLDGIKNYTSEQKSQGYGSSGYKETYSPGGTHRYDAQTGTWVAGSSGSSSSSSGSSGSKGKKK